MNVNVGHIWMDGTREKRTMYTSSKSAWGGGRTSVTCFCFGVGVSVSFVVKDEKGIEYGASQCRAMRA